MELTKTNVKHVLGVTSDFELARLFGIGRWAVGQWPDNKPIPEGRQWELRAKHPDKFPMPHQKSAA